MLRLSAPSNLICLAALVPLAAAQLSPAWAQCGGIGWTGPTICVPGYNCVKVNEYHPQCLPGYWFSFGDSYTQTGFQPTGILPYPGNALGNPPYPGFTATGGENWVDYVTTRYNKSVLLTYNYAYGGATIDANLVKPFEPSVLSMTDQVNQFLGGPGVVPSSTPWHSNNSLFSFFIGINDIGNSWYLSGDRDAFSDTLLNAYFALVQKLYDVGARNLLFVNVPPIDRSPLQLSSDQPSRDAEAAVIKGFNTKLVAKINSFKSVHTDVVTYLWDSHTQFTTMLDDPQSYGFKDATSYGSDANEFWGNNYHPSSYAHKFFGQTVRNDVLGNTLF